MKILIAEDEQRTRQGMERMIRGIEGKYELLGAASNGQMALDMIMQMKPDTVFIDIKMPFLDGLSVIRAVRSQGMSTEFVVVSAYADFEFAQQSIELEVAGYLLKPPTKEEVRNILKKIEDRLNRKHSYTVQKEMNLRDKYPDAHLLILRALDIIQDGYAGKISQKELAGSLGLSPEYFSYLFNKNTGENFSTFLRNYRIEQAQRMYCTEECDKHEIPYAVGFSDAKYFKKVFKEVTGKSPSEYVKDITKS